MKSFAGVFEVHLTVSMTAPPADADESLALWAEQHGMKYGRILLDRGETAQQPMLTFHGSGTLPMQLLLARLRAGELRAARFDVQRVKIEAAPWNQDVPRTAAEASLLPPGCYFEHHVKLALADEAEVAAVRRIGTRHAGHLSRNARRGVRGGRHERFLTQRCRLVGHPEAHRMLQALLDGLTRAGHKVIEAEEEFVVHDDNPGLDRGWAGT